VMDVQCGLSGENNPIFTNAPVVTQSAGSPTSYDVIFQLTSPPTAGSSLCSVSFTDQANSFPNGPARKDCDEAASRPRQYLSPPLPEVTDLL